MITNHRKNRLSAKKLLHSKWTKHQVVNKQRHFMVVEVEYDEDGRVSLCVVEALINKQRLEIDWREFYDQRLWQPGWH